MLLALRSKLEIWDGPRLQSRARELGVPVPPYLTTANRRLSAFFDMVQQDPVVSQVKLIAEPWDVGDGGYQVGNFPPLWSEWNGKYRDSIRDLALSTTGQQESTAPPVWRSPRAAIWPVAGTVSGTGRSNAPGRQDLSEQDRR